MRRLFVLCISVVFAVILFTNCPGNTDENGDDTDTPIANPSFSNDIQSLFNASCAISGCHNQSAQGGLNLSTGQAYANLVNAASVQDSGKIRVVPQDANGSYLVIKLEGRQTVGSKMPIGRTFSTAKIQTIKNWINNGAEDN